MASCTTCSQVERRVLRAGALAPGTPMESGKARENLVLFRPAPRTSAARRRGEPGVWVPVEGKPITHEKGGRASLLSMSCIQALDSLLGAAVGEVW